MLEKPASVILYASQIAACIGYNRHKRPAEAMEAMWARVAPHSYRAALERTHTVTEDQHLSELSNNETVRSLLVDSNVIGEHSRDVAIKYDAAAKFIERLDEMSDTDKRLIDAAVKKNLFTNYGTASEDHALRKIRDLLGISARRDDTFYKCELGIIDGVSVWVGGKIDAITDDRIVIEIKNRIRRLFYKIPFYEQIQLQTYLHLLDTARGAVVECLTTPTDSHLNIVPIRRDKALWNDVIVPKIFAFASVFLDLLADLRFQDAFLVKGAKKNAMIQNRLNQVTVPKWTT